MDRSVCLFFSNWFYRIFSQYTGWFMIDALFRDSDVNSCADCKFDSRFKKKNYLTLVLLKKKRRKQIAKNEHSSWFTLYRQHSLFSSRGICEVCPYDLHFSCPLYTYYWWNLRNTVISYCIAINSHGVWMIRCNYNQCLLLIGHIADHFNCFGKFFSFI